MQYRKEALYREIQRQYPEMDKDFIQDYFVFITSKIKEWSENPDSLILNIKGLGRFYFKKKEVEMDLKQRSQYTDEYFKNAEIHQRFVDLARFVLKEYEKYDARKVSVRKQNYGKAYKDPEQLKKERLEFLEPIIKKK